MWRLKVLTGVILGAAVLAGAAAYAQVYAPPRPPQEGRQTRDTYEYRWGSRAGPSRLANYYPRESTDRSIPGDAEVLCTPDDRKGLKDCVAVSEAPVGMGFGRAAVKKVQVAWRMRPKRLKPMIQPDGRLLFAVHFSPERRSTRPLIVHPTWAAAPGFDDMAAAWPAAAGDLDAGAVTLRCAVGASGELRDCRVVAQNPQSSPFGEAALGLVDRFRLRPSRVAPTDTDVVVSFSFLNPRSPAASVRKVSRPHWVDVSGLRGAFLPYPAAAAEAGVTAGVGVVDCLIADDGALTVCQIAREDPGGLGFGQAALFRATGLRVSVWTPEGRPVSGVRIKVPIVIGVPDERLQDQPLGPRLRQRDGNIPGGPP